MAFFQYNECTCAVSSLLSLCPRSHTNQPKALSMLFEILSETSVTVASENSFSQHNSVRLSLVELATFASIADSTTSFRTERPNTTAQPGVVSLQQQATANLSESRYQTQCEALGNCLPGGARITGPIYCKYGLHRSS